MDDAFGGQQTLDISGDLAGEKQADSRRLLPRHERCFPRKLPMRLPPERQVSHEMKVEDGAKPSSRPPFRMSRCELDELQKQLDDLLSHSFIEPSNSQFGVPVFFIKRSEGPLRLVCDWRPLNKLTIKVQACLPNIEDLFDTISGAKFISKLELKSGYHQVRLCVEDVPKTAINTPLTKSVPCHGLWPDGHTCNLHGSDERRVRTFLNEMCHCRLGGHFVLQQFLAGAPKASG